MVVEDAISGLRAGLAAGATTLAVLTSTERSVIMQSDARPSYIVQDLTKYVLKKISMFVSVWIYDIHVFARVKVDIIGGKLHVTMDLS